MTSDEATVAVIDALNGIPVPYMVVGSLASNFHGVARATHDADFVVALGEVPIAALMNRLGPDFHLDPQLSFETVTGTTRFIVEPVGNEFRIECFLLSDDPFDLERFARRRPVRLFGRDAFIPTAEDTVLMKLLWVLRSGRAKDEADARNVIAVQGAALDWDYIHRWCERHGTRELLDTIRRSLPSLE